MASTSFNIFEELTNWATTLPSWQRFALKKLIEKDGFEETDYEEIFAEFMRFNQLWKKENPVKNYSLELPTASGKTEKTEVVLQKIKEVEGVNALVTGEELHFGPQVTLIYGPNASGKSGYARILKSACFTRSKHLEILGNINIPPEERNEPKAQIDMIDGASFLFQHGTPCPVLHDNFAVFDGTCIRVHIDEKNRFNVTPYLFDVFPRFIEVCGKIENLLSQEINKNRPDVSPYVMQDSSTIVANALASLSNKTNLNELKALAEFSETQEARLVEGSKQVLELKNTNPSEMIKGKKQEKNDLTSLVIKLNTISSNFNENTFAGIKNNIDEVNKLAELAETTSAAQFNSEPVQPIGTEAWRNMLAAAIAFNLEAYPDQEFPAELEDVHCVLCQQPLSENANDRLKRFFAFISSDTEFKLTAANQKLSGIRNTLNKMDLSFFGTQSVERRTLEKCDKQLCENVDAFITGFDALKKDVLSNIDSKNWGVINKFANNAPTQVLNLCKEIDNSIDELSKQDIEKEIKRLEEELSLLRDRKQLSKIFPKIEKAVEAFRWVHKAQQLKPIPHRHITIKQKELMKNLVAKGFEEEFRQNCNSMKLDAPLQFNITGTEGQTNRKLEFGYEAGDNVEPSRVLSEGEQTTVALSDFLAEIKLNKTRTGIIFDDPINSFDHLRKEPIAKRLINEGKDRQVIIFTHDIVFTQYLVSSAVDSGVSLLAQTVSRSTGKGPGVIDLEVFPHPHYEKQAREYAQNCLNKARDETGEERGALLEKGCAKLRTAYEYYIQKTLFGDVIGRWRENIKYTLAQVYFDEEIAKRVQDRMEYLSRYVDAHSHTPEGNENQLTIEILGSEISAFAEIRKEYNARRKAWENGKSSANKILS